MKCFVDDLGHGSPGGVAGIAAQYVKWEVEQAGGECVQSPSDADVALVTSTAPWEPKLKIQKRIPNGLPTFVGGQAGMTPASFESCATAVCVGEGRRFLRTLVQHGIDAACRLENAWVGGESRQVLPDSEFPWDVPLIRSPDGKIRVVESRGCKHKCLFCLTGWGMPYQPHPDGRRLKAACRWLDRNGEKYILVTNDAGISDVAMVARNNITASYRFRRIITIPPSRLPRTVRIGVDGLSERIRAAIGKRIASGELVDLCRRLVGWQKQVRLFLVCGYPLETDDDWLEFSDVVKGLAALDSGLIHMTFHAFVPVPPAPLSIFPLEDSFENRWDAFFERFMYGSYRSSHVHLLGPASRRTRNNYAQWSMAATKTELRRGWWHNNNPNWRVTYLAPPWKLRHLASCYARKLGRQDAIPDDVKVRP